MVARVARMIIILIKIMLVTMMLIIPITAIITMNKSNNVNGADKPNLFLHDLHSSLARCSRCSPELGRSVVTWPADAHHSCLVRNVLSVLVGITTHAALDQVLSSQVHTDALTTTSLTTELGSHCCKDVLFLHRYESMCA